MKLLSMLFAISIFSILSISCSDKKNESKKESMSRTFFISIDMPDHIKNIIKKIQDDLKKPYPNLKFENPVKLHLTLKFLGNCDDNIIDKIKEVLSKIQINCFKAKLGKLNYFSNKKVVNVIWIDLLAPEIISLQKEIAKNLKFVDSKEEKREFIGHITIARCNLKDNKEIEKVISEINIPDIEFNVNSFSLKKSELYNNSSVYSDIEKYYLS